MATRFRSLPAGGGPETNVGTTVGSQFCWRVSTVALLDSTTTVSSSLDVERGSRRPIDRSAYGVHRSAGPISTTGPTASSVSPTRWRSVTAPLIEAPGRLLNQIPLTLQP